jgi:hypothetical protein
MKAHKSLVKYALRNNATISVFDGMYWEVKRSTNYKEIIECIESVDVSQIRIRDTSGLVIGWALIVLDVGEDETVADSTITPFMDKWESLTV